MPTNQCTYELGGKGGKYTDVLCKSRKLQSKPTAVMAKQMIYNTRYVFATKMWTAAVPVEYMIHCTPALSQKQNLTGSKQSCHELEYPFENNIINEK